MSERGRRRRRRVRRRAAASLAVAGLIGLAPSSMVAPASASAALARATPCQAWDRSSWPSDGLTVGGTLYFVADDGVHGRELWRSDGTPTGTGLVKDIDPGPGESEVTGLASTGGEVYFSADDGVHGHELWKTDGTHAGTVMVKDIGPGGDDDDPLRFNATDIEVIGKKLFFTAEDGTHGPELWTSDGTRAGTVLVKDIAPGYAYSDTYNSPTGLTAIGDTLFFATTDRTHGLELWRTDGTTAGTRLVKDINPGAGGSWEGSPAVVDGSLFFLAGDGTNGEGLWESDGTKAGTHLVATVNPDENPSLDRASVAARDAVYGGDRSVVADGQLFFVADDGLHGRELWTSDGTEAGTVLVRDVNDESVDENGYDTYGGDVRNQGTTNLTVLGGVVYFSANDGVHGREPWTSDGTEAGTTLVADVVPGRRSSVPEEFTSAAGEVFFTEAREVTIARQLWTTDGTEAGTAPFGYVGPDGDGLTGTEELHSIGGHLFLAASGDDRHGVELWQTDGTPGGTAIVDDINSRRRLSVDPHGARTSAGKLSVTVAPNVPGLLRVRPVGGSEVRRWSGCVDAGSQRIRLSPTPAGARHLQRTGSLRVKLRFAFTQRGEHIATVVRSFTLRKG